MENFLRKTIIGLVFISVLTPFIVSSEMFFPFITGKNFFFRFITEIIFFLWILLLLYKKEYRPKFSFIALALTVFTGVVFLADVFAVNSLKAFWSNFERMEGFVTIAHLFAYFWVLSSVLKDKMWLLFARAYAISVFAMSLFSTGQIFFNSNFYKNKVVSGLSESLVGFLRDFFTINQGGVRVDGRLGNAAYLAGFMLLGFFITLFLLYRDRIKKWTVFYVISLLLSLLVIYGTATRGAILGLLGGLIVTALIIAIFEKKDLLVKKIAILSLVFVVIFSGSIYLSRNTNFVKQNPTLSRIVSISAKSDDAKARFMVWGMAIEGFKERPILGWGQEGFNFVFNKYFNPGMHGRESWFDRTHNIFLDWLISAGVLGFISYISLLVLIFIYLWGGKWLPNPRIDFSISEKAIFSGLVLGYSFHNIFVFDNVVSYLIFFSILAFFHHNRSAEFKSVNYKEEISESEAFSFYAPIFVVLFLLTFYFVNWKGLVVAHGLIEALKPQGGVSKNLDILEDVVSKNSFANQEVREQIYQMAVTLNSSNNSSIDSAVKARSLTFAEKELRKQIIENPKDARAYVFLGSLLSFSGKKEDAISVMEKASELSPKKQTILLSLADSYLKVGDKETAFTKAKIAYDSSPNIKELGATFGVVALYAGRLPEAQEAFEKNFGTAFPYDQKVIKAYIDLGYRQKVINSILERIKQDKTNLESYALLTQIYIDAGQKQNAIGALELAIKNIPSFKVQGEGYIKQIRDGLN